MAAPPPTYNPDRRPLPEGWITRYDDNYRAWYYVDTRAHPPRSSWEHPNGPQPSTPQALSNTNYPSPPNPLNRENYNTSTPYSPTPGGPGQQFTTQQQQYNQPGYSGGYQRGPQDQRYQQQTPYQTQPPYGGPPGNYGNPGNPGWPQQGWPQQPPAPLGYQPPTASQAIQPAPRSGRSHGGGIGLGGAAALGVGGLVGGALLTEAFDHHEEREHDEAYDQGYEDAQNNDFGGGDGDFNGPGW